MPKSQNAASRFFIERIGLQENHSKLSSQVSRKRLSMEKRRRLRSKVKSHFHTSSDHQGVKRQFRSQHLLPRPFDGSSVKGKNMRLARYVRFAATFINYLYLLLLLSRNLVLHSEIHVKWSEAKTQTDTIFYDFQRRLILRQHKRTWQTRLSSRLFGNWRCCKKKKKRKTYCRNEICSVIS